MKKLLKTIAEWCLPSDHDVRCSMRGTMPGFIPIAMAALAAAKAIKGGVDAYQKRGEAKNQNKANEANAENQYQSSLANENNMEDSRLTRTQGIVNALGSSSAENSRAISPELIEQFMKRRAIVARKGVPTKINTNFGSNLLGTAAQVGGDLASSYMKGLGGVGGDASQATSLRPDIGGSPVSFGGKTFDFTKKYGDF